MKKTLISAVVVMAALGTGWFLMSGRDESVPPELAQKLAACESLPNGGIEIVKEGARVFVNLPEDIYPFEGRDIGEDGAKAALLSSGEKLGPRKAGTRAFADAKCATHLYEFSGSGIVTIRAKSAKSGYPDYTVKFKVAKQ